MDHYKDLCLLLQDPKVYPLACNYLATSSSDPLLACYISENHQCLHRLWDLASDPNCSVNALTALVNLSGDNRVATLLAPIALPALLQSAEVTEMRCMIIANLFKIESLSPLFLRSIPTLWGFYASDVKASYLGWAILQTMQQCKPCEWGCFVDVGSTHISSPCTTRRHSYASIAKNWMLESGGSQIYQFPEASLSLFAKRLQSPEDSYQEDDLLPPYLSNTVEAIEEEAEIKSEVLDIFLLVASNESGRSALRNLPLYPVLREYERRERDEGLKDRVHTLVGYLHRS